MTSTISPNVARLVRALELGQVPAAQVAELESAIAEAIASVASKLRPRSKRVGPVSEAEARAEEQVPRMAMSARSSALAAAAARTDALSFGAGIETGPVSHQTPREFTPEEAQANFQRMTSFDLRREFASFASDDQAFLDQIDDHVRDREAMQRRGYNVPPLRSYLRAQLRARDAERGIRREFPSE
jgi:hypothetical protein